MDKAFEIVPTDHELDPEGRDTSHLVSIVKYHTVMVRARDCFGQGVIVAGRIVTSLFLVRNERMVNIHVPTVGQSQAVVSRRDESNHIALLEPVSLESLHRNSIHCLGNESINTGPIAAFSEPLIMADSSDGTARAHIMGMSFMLKVCPRKEEEMWRFEMDMPSGLIGGGIWRMDGSLTGLSLAVKDSFLKSSLDYHTHFYAMPAKAILEFVESH